MAPDAPDVVSRSLQILASALTGLMLCAAAGSAVAAPVQQPHVEVELIAEAQALSPGAENWVALRIAPEPGWHVYWRNPGDSGLPTRLQWTLPEGVSAGPIAWPYPQTERLGDLVNYGYEEPTLLLVPLRVASTISSVAPAVLQAQASWLVCKDTCIPGQADLSLSLPVSSSGTPALDDHWRAAFAAARARLPQPAPADWKASFSVDTRHKTFTLGLVGAKITSAGSASFFPYDKNLINHASPSWRASDDRYGFRLTRQLNQYFKKETETVDGIIEIKAKDQTKAWEIHARPGSVEAVPAIAAEPATAEPAPAPPSLHLSYALLFALLGGLALNLMPCVFPVLSLKALSLVEARGGSRGRQQAHALAYTAGVLATFLILAGLLLLVRASGQAVGWGFQLQSPGFVTAMAYLFFAMGLAMAGWVEFGVRLMGIGTSLASAAGYRGSFFTGALAVAVASPCSAPFMGTALGYAVVQPPAIALGVFLALGLGLSLPFLVLGFIPVAGRYLPKPGKWMNIFKQFMSFPIFLTVAWLLWVLGGLSGRDGVGIALLGLIGIAFVLWLRRGSRPFARVLAYGVATLVAITVFKGPAARLQADTVALAANAAHEPWSEQKVAQLRTEGRTIFVDFTADWCLSCKFNEHGALASDAVHQAFADGKVVWLEADWTRADPSITRTLEHFGRTGVPLYLVYVDGGEPKLLPQLLTPSMVVDALKHS